MSSIFTKIINKEIKGYKVYEDEYVYAILDSNPIAKGHTLVIPKQEVDSFFSLDEDTYHHLMSAVKYLGGIIKERTKCARVCLVVEGYGVPHAHVHLMPTNSPEDFDKTHAYKASDDELLSMQTLLQS